MIDAKFTSRQFIKALPPTEQPLPMLEPAIVVGVSDAAKLKQAFAEYYAVADDFVEVLKGIEKSEIPKDFKIPRPRVYNLRQGTAYGYPLPAEWGVDSRVLAQCRRVGEGGRALAFRQAHAAACSRRRNRRSPGCRCRPIGRLAAVGGLDFAAFVDALTPWVELALDKGTVQLPPQDAEMARATCQDGAGGAEGLSRLGFGNLRRGQGHRDALAERVSRYRGVIGKSSRVGPDTVPPSSSDS